MNELETGLPVSRRLPLWRTTLEELLAEGIYYEKHMAVAPGHGRLPILNLKQMLDICLVAPKSCKL